LVDITLQSFLKNVNSKFLVRKTYNLYLSKDRHFAKRCHSTLGFIPKNLELFKLAFYHKSNNVNQVGRTITTNNERLEYLGDSILSTIVAEYLFKKYPNGNEGFLTKMRSKIVKRKTLNYIADKMGLDFIMKEFTETRLSNAMLGNALEALVGAIYIERGYAKTRNYVINELLRKYIDIHQLEIHDDNFKSQLLEWCQKNGKNVDYKVIQKFKFDKRDRFRMGVYVDGKQIAEAEDFNKKSAEQLASELALSSLNVISSAT